MQMIVGDNDNEMQLQNNLSSDDRFFHSEVKLTRTTMTTNNAPTNTIMALSSHGSQFSGLRPISARSRIRSPCRENSSQTLERTE